MEALSRERLERLTAARPAMELIALEPCLIPASRLETTLLTLTDQDLPVIDEFLLRSAAVGLGRLSEVSRVLGLDRRDLVAAATTRQREGQLRLEWQLSDDGQPDALLHLTPAGEDGARELRQHTTEKVEREFLFDRLTWQLAIESPSQTLRAGSARKSGHRILPALRNGGPQADDVTVEALQRLTRGRLGIGHGNWTILAVDSMSARATFIPGELAIYRSRANGTVELDIWVRERLDEERSRALAEAGGPGALGIQVETAEPPSLDDVPAEARQVLAQIGPSPAAAALAKQVAEVAQLSAQVEAPPSGAEYPEWDDEGQGPGPPSTERIRAELTAALERLRVAEIARAEEPLVRLDTFDHPDLLQRALRRAATRLLIISPWITPTVVDHEFLQALEALCREGLPIHIGYGIAAEDPNEPDDNSAIRRLGELDDRFDNFTLRRLGDTHAKVLIWDRSWVSTSFNWLSFRGDRSRAYRQEEGVLIRSPDQVDAQYQRMLERFDQSGGLGMTTGTVLPPLARTILALADQGESKTTEFKSSARWNLHSKQRDEEIEHAVVKTIAAFLNSDGGHLLIGVDDGGAVVGLKNDYKLGGKKDRDPQDSFQNWLTGLVEQQLGGATFNDWDVAFQAFPAGDVCVVTVRRSTLPVYLKRRQDSVQFYVRANNTTRELGVDQLPNYLASRFPAGA